MRDTSSSATATKNTLALAHSRRREVVILQALISVLRRWQEIVSLAQKYPNVALSLFNVQACDDSININNNNNNNNNRDNKNTNNKKEQEQQGRRRAHQPLMSSKATSPPLSSRVHPRGTGNGKGGKKKKKGNEKNKQIVHAGASTHVSGCKDGRREKALRELLPCMDWVQALQAQHPITSFEGESHVPRQEQQQEEDERRNKKHTETVLDDDFLKKMTRSVHTALTGMSTVLTTIKAHQKNLAPSAGGGTNSSSNSNRKALNKLHESILKNCTANIHESVMTQVTRLFELDYYKLRDTLIGLHVSFLRRMSYVFKEVLHEFQGVKQGLRDSVELCALQKNYIRRLSSELHSEDRVGNPLSYRGHVISRSHTSSSAMDVVTCSGNNSNTPALPQSPGRMSSCPTCRAHYPQPLGTTMYPRAMSIYEEGRMYEEFEENGKRNAFSMMNELPASHEWENNHNHNSREEDDKMSSFAELDFWEGEENTHSSSRSPLLREPPALTSTLPHSSSGPYFLHQYDHQYRRRESILSRFGFAVGATEYLTTSSLSSLTVKIIAVQWGSPAHEAGLCVDNLLLEVNGMRIPSTISLWEELLRGLLLQTVRKFTMKVARDEACDVVSTVTIQSYSSVAAQHPIVNNHNNNDNNDSNSINVINGRISRFFSAAAMEEDVENTMMMNSHIVKPSSTSPSNGNNKKARISVVNTPCKTAREEETKTKSVVAARVVGSRQLRKVAHAPSGPIRLNGTQAPNRVQLKSTAKRA